MLQQTRVAAVIPYYEKFLAAFPDADALARAPEERVLAMWAGLGYYSRARNLQHAARQIRELGRFPRDYESIRGLAGVGDYTAAAIASIAFGSPHAAVDGNVRRVIARLNATDADIRAKADNLLFRKNPGTWNQAMMELGATICLPRDPHCGECPIARQCQARSLGKQSDFPAKRAKPAPVRLTRTLLIIRRRGRIALVASPRVRGFWDLPEIAKSPTFGAIIGSFRHPIMHYHYRFEVREAAAKSAPKGVRWVAVEQLDEIPLSTVTRKALRLYTAPVAP